MKKDTGLITLPLLLGLFVYLFYRTEQTLVIKLFVYSFGQEPYLKLREAVQGYLALPDWIIYSLPEGLWIFCITLTSRFFYIRIRSFILPGILVPLLFCLGFELLQLTHKINGRFDPMDIGLSLVFWGLAVSWFRPVGEYKDFFKTLNRRSFLCILTYSIVYLAHVAA